MTEDGAVLKTNVILSLACLAALAACSDNNMLTGSFYDPFTETLSAVDSSGASRSRDSMPATAVSECASPRAGWIWCDDFEQDRMSRYFEYHDAGGRFVRKGGSGLKGSTGMRTRWNRGDREAGFLHLAFGKTPQAQFRPVDDGAKVYREVYWRMYLKHQDGWVGGGADKLSRAINLASSNSYAEAVFAHVWSGNSGSATSNYLRIDPASGRDESGNLRTTSYNDFPNMRWLGAATGRTPIFDAAHVGKWYCVEAHVRLNSAGASDGFFELWVDGVAEAQRSGLNFVGSAAYGINAVYFENFWNGVNGAGAVADQERYFDNIVVSTQRIGC